MAAFRTFWNSPVGPKTTHFWGPIANFSFVVATLPRTLRLLDFWKMTLPRSALPLRASASLPLRATLPCILSIIHQYHLQVSVTRDEKHKGLADTQKPPDMISGNMTGVMCIYSVLIMRFAWVVQPRNYLLMACHASNETVQLYQLSRWSSVHGYLPKKEEPKKK